MDANTGSVIAGSRDKETGCVASMTKIAVALSAITLSQHIDGLLSETLTVSHEVRHNQDESGFLRSSMLSPVSALSFLFGARFIYWAMMEKYAQSHVCAIFQCID